ncbi:prepilin-type N-terminal cleavage/methylation domain-containing protein [Parashewanella spongiae]|uniref:Type II secretion system protein H n=1 Tax=Parashewanella spongiae TaxID=342950 RepID=A0A3A6TQ01_9GAMM|nr:GspH/FimT family pseudopilin [Parashewanella spongiae]MCL1079515.1 GspH/FimT family pseudopilin [Parashewanella spongiae]RJY07500.1 prepilin-type N-terminal cleavage/methylation domain-containing protein [Parashewanella spongiae]
MRYIRGFTLVEAMVTIAIAAILILVGAPSLNSFYQNVRAEQSINKIQTTLAFARNQAMSYDISVEVCPANGCDGNWNTGIQVFTFDVPQAPLVPGQSADRVQPARMILRETGAFNRNDTVMLTPTTFTFLGSGKINGLPDRQPTDNPITLSYCPNSKNANAIGLEIRKTGSTQLTNTGLSCN